jgi:hypothetical protein
MINGIATLSASRTLFVKVLLLFPVVVQGFDVHLNCKRSIRKLAFIPLDTRYRVIRYSAMHPYGEDYEDAIRLFITIDKRPPKEHSTSQIFHGK